MKLGPIDILCLCTPHGVGGAQNNAGRLTKAFRNRGYNAHIGFLFEREPEYRNEIEDYFVIADKQPESIREWRRFLSACHREIGGLRPRATMGFHPLANIIGALATGGSGRFVSRQAWPKHEQGRGTQILESLMTRTSRVYSNVAVSQYVAESFQSRGKAYQTKTQIIYNAPPELPPVSDDKSACRMHFGMPATGRVLGTLGRLHEQKNYQLAIRAMTHAPDDHLYMAGSGPQSEMLQQLARDLGVANRVHFLGMLRGAEISKFLKSVDLLLMTSIYEGHPMAMLEAMSNGVPVLAHDVSVLREAGKEAVRYASSDPADWGKQLADLTPDVLSDMRDQGRIATSEFTMDAMADRYLAALGFAPFAQTGA